MSFCLHPKWWWLHGVKRPAIASGKIKKSFSQIGLQIKDVIPDHCLIRRNSTFWRLPSWIFIRKPYLWKQFAISSRNSSSSSIHVWPQYRGPAHNIFECKLKLPLLMYGFKCTHPSALYRNDFKLIIMICNLALQQIVFFINITWKCSLLIRGICSQKHSYAEHTKCILYLRKNKNTYFNVSIFGSNVQNNYRQKHCRGTLYNQW